MKEIIDRLKVVSSCKAKSIREFAEKISVPQTTLNNQLISKRALSLDTVLSVVNSFEDISAEWLLRGKGDMLLSASSEINSASNNEIEALKAEINRLKGENSIMREMLNLGARKENERTKTA